MRVMTLMYLAEQSEDSDEVVWGDESQRKQRVKDVAEERKGRINKRVMEQQDINIQRGKRNARGGLWEFVLIWRGDDETGNKKPSA